MSDTRAVEIGFPAGGGIRLRLTEQQYDELRTALKEGTGARWHEIAATDATVTLDLSQVIFVRLDTEPDRVGF